MNAFSKHKTPLICFLVFIFSATFSSAQTPDYANLDNWAAHKDKWDMADSLPKPLKKQKNEPKLANVFFIHPTTYTESEAYKANWNANITNQDLNKKTDNSTILFQASCFNEQSYVYAPRYRQAHIQAFYIGTTQAKAALDTAYSDIKAAFEYFLSHLNNNQPIIIAAHSQGTVHAQRLIQEYFENKPLMQNLVAAYLIGMPIKKDVFTTCKPCAEQNQFGCFVSWRTYLNGHEDGYLTYEPTNSILVTNPLTWSLDTIATSKKDNHGAVLLKFNKILKRVSNAKVHNNILWISKPKFPFSFLVRNKRTNYHIADINLFYINIRENVKARLTAYLISKNHPQ